MPRIRTIKPEFWDSPSTAKASKTVRLLYLAMWNWADDHGRGTANASQLLSFAFPNDAELPTLIAEAPRVYAEVADAYEVVFYEVAGRRYYAVLNWNDHQKNERKANSKHPPPPEDVLAGQRPAWAACAEMRGSSAQSNGDSGTGTGEQGNRGTGEEKTCPAELDVSPAPSPKYSDDFLDWYEHYPRKDSKGAAAVAFKKALRRASLTELIDGAARYAADPNRLPEYTKLPASWLNADCWLDGPLPPRGGNHHPDPERNGWDQLLTDTRQIGA